MTVAELIKELQTLPPETLVVLQEDAEGNGYSPLEGVDAAAFYEAENCWSGRVWNENWSAAEAGFRGDYEWENFKKSLPRCCVLHPIN